MKTKSLLLFIALALFAALQLPAASVQDQTNKIYYTSTDGNAMEPFDLDVFFGANIVSNTYADGQGCIAFDGPVTQIGSGAFNECKKLATITLPESVTNIASAAFQFCSSLSAINLPAGVTSIGMNAFLSCASLTAVTLPESLTSIGMQAFFRCGISSITIPASVTSIAAKAFTSPALTSLSVDDGNESYDSRGGCNAIIETATNTLIHGSKVAVIPTTVTSIGDEAFSFCTDITTITIPESVTSIGQETFKGCSTLNSVTCKGATAPTIGENIFINVAETGTLVVPNFKKYASWIAEIPEGWTVVDNNTAPAGLKGDVNEDGKVDVSDVTNLVGIILGTAE